MVTYLHYWQFEWGFGKFHPMFWCKTDVIQLVLIIVGQTTSLVLTINTWRTALFGNEVCNFMCLFYMSWTIVCELCAKSLSLKDALIKRSIRNTVISVLGVFEFVRNMKTRIFPFFFENTHFPSWVQASCSRILYVISQKRKAYEISTYTTLATWLTKKMKCDGWQIF